MPDPIQSSSSMPLPPYQTMAGTRNPVPYGGLEDIAQQNADVSQANANTTEDQFQDYLNQSAILTLQAQQQARAREFDTVQDIQNSSVYQQTKTSSTV